MNGHLTVTHRSTGTNMAPIREDTISKRFATATIQDISRTRIILSMASGSNKTGKVKVTMAMVKAIMETVEATMGTVRGTGGITATDKRRLV